MKYDFFKTTLKTLMKSKTALISSICIGVIFLLEFGWLVILPHAIQSDCTLNLAKNCLKNSLGMDLELKNLKLKTKLNPEIDFSIDNFLLKKDNTTLVQLENFNSSINYKRFYKKTIKLNRLEAKKLVVYVDKLLDSIPQTQGQETTVPDWKIDLYNSKMALDELNLSYRLNNSSILVDVNSIKITQNNADKTLDFNSRITVSKNNQNYLNIIANAKDEVKLAPSSLKTEGLDILVNSSRLQLNTDIDDKNIKLNAKSDLFFLEDVFKIIQSDIVIPDGEKLLAPLVNPKGKIAYDVNVKSTLYPPYKQEMDGVISVNNTKASLKDLTNLPLNVEKGKLVISKDKIDFQNLEGYYGKNNKNRFKIYGDIKDYYKSLDSNIIVDTQITNEFFKNYLAKLIANTALYTSSPIGTRIIYKSKFNIMDIEWLAKINKGVNFGIDNSKSALSDYDRAVKGDFHIEDNNLVIKNINYYIASNITKGSNIKPIITVDGSMDLMGNINNIGFFFAREMPCELLNIVMPNTFKKGTIKGNLHVAFKGKTPILNSDMEIKDTFIPSQRMKIKEAKLKTTSDYILTKVDGRFKKANFEFKGRIKNELIAPYTIKDLILNIDDLDIERILASFNSQQNAGQNAGQTQKQIAEVNENTDDDFMFDTNLVRIENGKFRLKSGKYKDLTFGNIDSDITLDNKGVLKIQSNKFDIAGGISTLKVICDLSKLNYYLRLGAKDVDSNLMASTLLNLDKEISGKASGLIELTSDKSMKMNGQIRFLVNEGTIGKIGLVEYVLKIASVFRNPIVMVSPQTIMDIVSIPEGKFNKISGDMKIKDNVIQISKIQSSSAQLSALIKGRFDLDKHDASLRIYTRFSSNKNTRFNFLRNVSLNALANKVQMNTRNDANYYASELKDLPEIDIDNSKAQIFLTQVEGDIEHNNFLSMLKKIK